MLVHLIADYDEVVFDGNVANGLTFLIGECHAGWVVRRIDQKHGRARGNGRFQRVEVNTKVGCTKRHGYAHASCHGDARRVRVVVRLEGDDFVTFINERQDRAGNRLGGAGSD